MQKLLNKKLKPSPNLDPDGDFGPQTERAVRAFQAQASLGIDGVVGKKTWAALEGRSATPPPAPVVMPQGAPWMAIAEKEQGQREVAGSNHNARIIEYHRSTTLQARTDETAWCSSFVNWCLKQAHIKGTNSAAAASWVTWGAATPPKVGAITVIYNPQAAKSLSVSGNHVGFLIEESALLLRAPRRQSEQQRTRLQVPEVLLGPEGAPLAGRAGGDRMRHLTRASHFLLLLALGACSRTEPTSAPQPSADGPSPVPSPGVAPEKVPPARPEQGEGEVREPAAAPSAPRAPGGEVEADPTPPTEEPPVAADEGSLEAFWTAFRAAVERRDAAQVAALTAFPFKTRGSMDFDPVIRHDRAAFFGLFERLMSLPVESLQGGKLTSSTMAELIVAQRALPTSPSDPNRADPEADAYRFEDFEFQRRKGKWRFTFAYLDE